MKQKNKKKAGFSIIEVLFAMLFMSVIIFGVIKLQTSNLTLTNTQKLELKAHFIAAQSLEVLKAIGPDQMDDDCPASPCQFSPADPHVVEPYDSNDPDLVEAVEFERQFTYSPMGTLNDYEVTMKISWTDTTGDHEVEAKRVIFD